MVRELAECVDFVISKMQNGQVSEAIKIRIFLSYNKIQNIKALLTHF